MCEIMRKKWPTCAAFDALLQHNKSALNPELKRFLHVNKFLPPQLLRRLNCPLWLFAGLGGGYGAPSGWTWTWLGRYTPWQDVCTYNKATSCATIAGTEPAYLVKNYCISAYRVVATPTNKTSCNVPLNILIRYEAGTTQKHAP